MAWLLLQKARATREELNNGRTERTIIMKSRTDPSKFLRPWLRAAWRSLLLLVVGSLLGATVAGGGLSAQSGKAGRTASMADAAGSHDSKATRASSVPGPAGGNLRGQA